VTHHNPGKKKTRRGVGHAKGDGSRLAPGDAPIRNLADLKGKRLGIAGGPLDKSWLLFRALATKRHGMDLDAGVDKVFGAPPLSSEPCASRERREIDWGGCRCQALAITGDAAQTDPAGNLSPRHAELVALAEAESEREPPAFEYRRMTRKEAVEA
jgi:hypothetical protein